MACSEGELQAIFLLPLLLILLKLLLHPTMLEKACAIMPEFVVGEIGQANK